LIPLWLHLCFALGIALLAWVLGMDTTGSLSDQFFLWVLAVLCGAHLFVRLLVPRMR
jgi:hypothetical protein